jgi:hypothetical protein
VHHGTEQGMVDVPCMLLRTAARGGALHSMHHVIQHQN